MNTHSDQKTEMSFMDMKLRFSSYNEAFANGGMGEKLKTGIGNVVKKEIMQIGKERVR
jgi:hypothetical protein